MELSFSPDLDARICYAIVFLAGLVTAAWQVGRRVGKFPGAWSVLRTWLLYLAFVPVPVGLFWLLDRLSVLHDTSLFGALIVGVAYDRILAGGFSSVRAPGGLDGFWKAFSVWADSVRNVVFDRTEVNSRRFDERVLAGLLEDEAKLQAIKDLVLSRSEDVNDLLDRLQQIEGLTPTLGEAVVRERRARLIFDEVGGLPDFQYLMKSKGIISRRLYYRYALDLRGKLMAAGIVSAILLIAIVIGMQIRTPDNQVRYLIWRLQKQNATVLDEYRARTHLIDLLQTEQDATGTRARLIGSLMKPDVPGERIDIILALLLETRSADSLENDVLAHRLVQALRTSSVDARARIHYTLLFLAQERVAADPNHSVPDALTTWNAADNDSATGIEEHVKRWKEFWNY